MSSAQPYSKFRLFLKWISYRRNAIGKQSVHSPLVFAFVTEVLQKAKKNRSRKIERQRKRLLKDETILDFKDFGKGGQIFRTTVKERAKKTLTRKKYVRLLARTASVYNAKNILELGTSFGITTSYLAQVKGSKVTTLEGAPNIIEVAKEVWSQLGIDNINAISGNFDITLQKLEEEQFDLVFVDGNHHYKPTLQYFELILKMVNPGSIVVFDDIHHSSEMEKAWEAIKNHNKVQTTVDLFRMGFVFLDAASAEQHYVVKY
jgi:predicted O-methyltransferase YrrM